ncbi:hypothetical protein AB0F17_65680 [Nonomuraea sp. NPDC026600]|uniref:hypothetical protein n=1 Tax=Nonomuraea sp. NPDC026600 TaxID=3155363 RepID=UPI0033F0AAD2
MTAQSPAQRELDAAYEALDVADQARIQAALGDEPCLSIDDAHGLYLEACHRVSEAGEAL